MTAKLVRLLALLAFMGMFFVPASVSAEAPPDTIDTYVITITPQQDGSLVMSYAFQNYCVGSDWSSDDPAFSVGVPNSKVSLSDWGPKEWFTKGQVEGSLVKLYFDSSKLPKKGTCLNVNFTINQEKMAYPDPENGNITFKFIPSGWEFPTQVKTLIVAWAMPSDQTLLKYIEPKPGASDGVFYIWQYQNPVENASDMFVDATVKLAYDKSAFTLSEAATSNQEGGGEAFNWQCCWTIFWIIVIILVIWFIVAVVYEAYDSGDGIGPSVVVVLDHAGEAASDFISAVGDAGGSSGHGSGCAGGGGCACACACAGGGRAGCSRKSFGVSKLSNIIKEMSKE